MAQHGKIIVIGAGTVGNHISELLQRERYEVVVIDKDKDRLDEIGSRLDVQTLHGHGGNPAVLAKAGVAGALLVLSVTNLDDVNLLALFTAKRLGAARCVARARSSWCQDTSVMNLRRELGIDLILNPEDLTAMEILRYLDDPDALALASFAHGKVQLRTFTLDDSSEYVGRPLRDIPVPEGVLIGICARNGDVMIPRGDTEFAAGDKITILGVPEKLPRVQHLLHKSTGKPRNVVIAGAGGTGLYLARALESRHFHVKVMDSDRERCHHISERLNHATVVCGNATDIGTLKEERVDKCDVFIGVTGDDEENLMSCLLARELGVRQTVVRIHRPDYASLVQKFGIDLALSPRHVMAEKILTLVSHGGVRSVTLLEDGKVEVNELVPAPGSPMVGKPLSELSLPRGTLLGAIVHHGETVIPRGANRIEPGDSVVALGLSDAMDALEAKFEGR